MFRFENPDYLYLLVLVALFALLYLWSNVRQRRRLRRLGDVDELKRLMPERSKWRPWLKWVLCMLALVGMVLMLARPQYGRKKVQETREGIEMVVMVDVSQSMLCEDVRPNRLERSKLFVSNLIAHLQNDKIALGVFAGEAYPELPMTSDYGAAKLMADAISTDMMSMQGTDVGAALEVAAHCFSDKKVGKAVLLITDGEDHEGGLKKAAEALEDKGVELIVLGVGTTKGGVIPTKGGVLRTDKNEKVITVLNEEMGKELAELCGGSYVPLTNSNGALKSVLVELSRLEKTTMAESVEHANEQFQAFGIVALLLLLMEYVVMGRQNHWLGRVKWLKKEGEKR